MIVNYPMTAKELLQSSTESLIHWLNCLDSDDLDYYKQVLAIRHAILHERLTKEDNHNKRKTIMRKLKRCQKILSSLA